jgi:predicted house-cleaning noncanonical NTP pyrophosphatase (MazG superfamily)
MKNIYIVNGEVFGNDEITYKFGVGFYNKNGEILNKNEVICFSSISEALDYHESRKEYYLEELKECPERENAEFYHIMIERMEKIISKLKKRRMNNE